MEIVKDSSHVITDLQNENETLRIQLAACGVLALSNTEDSLKQNYNMKTEYKCASVEDVANMAKREISLIKERDELKAHSERLTRHINKLDKHAYDHEEGGVLNCAVKKQYFESAIQAAEQTPKQSLAEIKAQAVNDLLNQPFVKFYSLEDDVSQYIIDGEGFDRYMGEQSK